MQDRGDGVRKFPWTGNKARRTDLEAKYHKPNKLMCQLGVTNYDAVNELNDL